MTNNIQKEFLATTAGLISLGGLTALNFPILIGGLAGVGLYSGVKLLLSSEGGIKITTPIPENLQKTIQKITSSINTIRTQNKKIQESKISQAIDKICTLGEKVVEVLSDEPNSDTLINEVYKLFKNLEEMLDKYLNLSNHSVDYKDLDSTLDDFHSVLKKIETALNQYYKKGIKSDLKSFETDIKIVDTKLESLNEL